METYQLYSSKSRRGFTAHFMSLAAKRFTLILASAVTLATSQSALAQNSAHQEVVNGVINDINLYPDHACKLPQKAIETWISSNVNRSGLMDNVSRTVFHEDPTAPAPLSGYQAMLEKIRQDTARRSAEIDAMYRARATGGQTPVGDQPIPETTKYRAEMHDAKAVKRIENGLDCAAQVTVDFLRIAIAYNVTVDPNDNDGWDSKLNNFPLTEAGALAVSPSVLVHYGDNDLTLAQARQQSQFDSDSKAAADLKAKRDEAALAAYQNSPAGRLTAAQQRQSMVVKKQSCENHGGTWGVPFGNTIVQVDPRTASGLVAMEQACYFLGKR